jgi:hypothetical protein
MKKERLPNCRRPFLCPKKAKNPKIAENSYLILNRQTVFLIYKAAGFSAVKIMENRGPGMDTYLTAKEVALKVKLSLQTIRRYTMKKEIPFHKIYRRFASRNLKLNSGMKKERRYRL